MEDQNYKCSLHKEIDACKYCQECIAYFCNNCEKSHSELLKHHHLFLIEKNTDELFTGYCKENNHQKDLHYLCKDHNLLCCVACISKIKTRENGKHFDCNVCDINDIYEEKKKNLSDNIKYLENLSNLFQSLVDDLKKIIEEIDENILKVKEKIQKIFSKIRSELNKREGLLLNDVDGIFEKKFSIKNINNILKEKKIS